MFFVIAVSFFVVVAALLRTGEGAVVHGAFGRGHNLRAFVLPDSLSRTINPEVNTVAFFFCAQCLPLRFFFLVVLLQKPL